MAKQDIDIGVEGNDGTGDSIRESFRKVNENFQELYAVFGAGGQISFTNLGDTPTNLDPRKILLVNDSGTALEYQELASDSAKGTGDPDSITISYDIAGKIILSTAFRAVSQDLSPTLGAPLDADGRGIAKVAINQAAVNEFNATHPGDDITIDDLVITKGFADNRYIAGELPIRVDDEPADASEYTLVVESYTDGNITVTDHGFDNTINGTPYVFNAEDTDPSNLVTGTTYYLRYASPSQLSVHRTEAGALDDTDQAFITFNIAADDTHTFVDAGFDSNLKGFFLSNEAMPRKSIVRRQGDVMTGPLVLHDSPGELSGLTTSPEDLQAATKFYVDNTSYSSPQNLYVSTTGDDKMRGVPSGKEGTSWSYAFRSINAAARRAEEMIKASEAEPGPYFQTITRDNGAANAEVVSVGINNPLFGQARNLIEENREFIIREITAYLNFEYPEFEYNIKLCERDLGLILDAIAFDINRSPSLTEATANSLTRRAAERYYNSASGRIAIGRQLTETVDAIETARDIVEQILQNRRFQQGSVSSISQSAICTVTTVVNHGFVDKNIVYIENVSGMTQINDAFYYIKVTGPRTFELFTDEDLEIPVNSVGFDQYSGQGSFGLVYQTDNKQFIDAGDDAEAVARQAVVDKFNLVVNIITNGIDAGASTAFGKTYRVIVNNGGLVATDQGNIDNRDVLPGKVLVGKISGAQGRVVTYNQNDANFNGNDNVEVHLLKPIDFIEGEDLEYGNFVNTEQVTIFIESGQYTEDYPIKVAANVSLKGDEFRRVIVRPKRRVSQSPWAGTYTYRDKEFDGLETSTGGARFYNQTGEWQGYFGYHYLTNPEKVVNTGVPVNNVGEFTTAANIITENREFIQNEVIEYINQNTQDLLYDKNQFGEDMLAILSGIGYDIVLDSTFNARRLGLKFQREKSIYRDQQLKDIWVVALTEAKRLVAGLPAVSSSSDATSRANAAFDTIITIIEDGTLDTDNATLIPVYNTVNTTDPNEEAAKNKILDNIEFIAAEALTYLTTNYPRKFFNEDIRLRDARNMSYALAYDIMYGGNSATVDFVKDYFIGDELRLEIVSREPTLEMITHIKTVITSVVRNIAVIPTTGNAIAQDISGTPATATEATTIGLYIDIIFDQINNNNLLNIPSTTFPSLIGLDSALIDAKTGIDGGATSIRDASITVVDASPEAVFTYNQLKCKRDVGLIVDALAKDLEIGGDEYSLEVQGEYFDSYILKYNNGGFGGQENVTKNAIEFTGIVIARLFQGNYNPNDIWQNPNDSSYVEPDFKFGTAELGTNIIVNNLIDRMVFAFDRRYNPPKRNDEMDVFLMNDASILRNMTVQGHGGFLCVLDPAGQILTKSPYVQTGSSFSKSINEKIFAGGMFVDAYVGNLPATIPTTIDVGNGVESGKINNFTLWIRSEEGQGLFIRPPELPCPFYLEGRRFQVNAISDYDQGNGWCKIYLDTTSNDGNGFDETLFEERPGDIYRDIFLQTAGNRSMLGNDFTQINDLGYALVTTNGAFSEMVSMFTYYCHAAYYAANGSEIRSLNGSNGYGNFGLVAEGADPNEIPDQVTYAGDMTFAARTVRWFEEGDFLNITNSNSIHVTDLKRLPEPNSVLTINHPGAAGTLQYGISVISDYGDGTNAGDKVVTGVHTVTGIGAADASRAQGTYTAVSADGDLKGATFTVTVDGSGAATITVVACGEGYTDGDSLTILDSDLGGGGAADLVFTVDKVYGSDGTSVIPTGRYSNKIYKLQITGTPEGTNGDFFSQVQEDIANGLVAEYRHSETHRFDNIRSQNRLVTRPSTAINFDESDEITYRSIAFSAFDSAGEGLADDQITVTFEVEYDHVELAVDSNNIGGGKGGAEGDLTIAVNPAAEGFVLDDNEITRLQTDINGNLPPATLQNLNASSLVQRNINYVQEETLAFVDANTPPAGMDRDKCFRDVGYIVSAIDHDIRHGGNAKTVEAALSYWDGATSQVAGQETETIAAINKAKEIVTLFILTQTAWPTINTNGATQDLTGDAAEGGAATLVGSLMDIVTDVIANGPSAAPDKNGYEGGMLFTWAGRTHQITRFTQSPAVERSNAGFAEILDILENGQASTDLAADDLVFPAPTGGAAGPVNAKDQLIANKAFLQAEVLEFIKINHIDVFNSMNKGYCSRDVGYITDALCYDVLYGGNSATITNARAYYVGTTGQLGTGQDAATIAAYNYLANIASDVVQGISVSALQTAVTQDTTGPGSTATEGTVVDGLVQIIEDVITAGDLDNIPATILPSTAWVESKFETARATLLSQRGNIQSATIGFINTEFPELVYDDDKCERDVGLMVDAVAYDVAIGTNYNSVTAGLSYQRGNAYVVRSNQQRQTIRAIQFVKDQAAQAIASTSTDPATLTIYGTPRTDLTDGASQGLAAGFTNDKILRAGLPDQQTAEITISISLCRATGHDFTQIGTGSFNDSNYPNVILGDPENTLAPFYTDSPNATSAQVWEKRKGRVFWMSTDQYGFFRVGKFFEVDQGQGSIKFSGEIGITGANALGFKKGVTIDEFSIDDTMADESDTAVPVEKAIVSYVNKRLGRDKNDNGVSGQIGPGFLPLSGTPEMTGDLQMGANKITNVQNPQSGSDAATKEYVDTKITEFDSFESVRNTETNRVEGADLVVFTGLSKVFTTVPSDSSGSDTFEVGDNIEDVSGNKTATVVDVFTTTDLIIGENEPGNNIAVITYELTNGSADFNQAEDIQGTTTKSTVSANIIRGPFDEVGHAREATGSVINVSLTRTPGVRADSLTDPIAEINFQIENDSIIDADINSAASIAQSKLLMERAKPLNNSAGLYGTGDDVGQGSRGLAVFDSDQFAHEVQLTLTNPLTANAGDVLYQNTNKGTVVNTIVNNTLVVIRTSDNFVVDSTEIGIAEIIGGVERVAQTQTGVTISDVDASGYIAIKDRAITLDKIETVPTDHVLGRSTDGTGIVEEVSFETVVDQGFGLLDADFEDAEITELTGTILTFASPISVANGETISQAATGASGTVQGRIESEDSVRLVNITGTFNASAVIASLSGSLGAPVAVSAGNNLVGAALIKQAEGVYGTTAVSIGSANNSMARRTSNGSLQATSYIIGGTSTNVVLAEAGGTITMTTPAGGKILESNGGNASSAPRVDMPGAVNIGAAGATDEGNAQGNVSALTGDGYVAAPWTYTNFIEALDTKETNNTTGFSLGAPSAYTSSALGTIVAVSNNTEALTINNAVVNSKVSFTVATSKFTVDATTGNSTVAGDLSVGGTLATQGGGLQVDALGNTTIAGTLNVTQATSLNGNVNLGNAAADAISVNGVVDTNIVPTGTRNLGSAASPWSTVYGTTFSGTATTAKYADLAENYLGDAPYDPGTVVVLGGEAEVTLTSAKGDRRVAGIVSTEPAHLMNSALEGEHVIAVALTGRVPCKVLGRVNKGDILVTSAIPGYACVDNNPAYGTIIGKAVEAKTDDSKGIIEVLVGK